mmetsp:Transcript_92215/g.197587  ORF Transcript_92215/g.197587 Transcript_92215/m.197587 type:complete len:263 (-) Transcript_92215:3-791(-)
MVHKQSPYWRLRMQEEGHRLLVRLHGRACRFLIKLQVEPTTGDPGGAHHLRSESVETLFAGIRSARPIPRISHIWGRKLGGLRRCLVDATASIRFIVDFFLAIQVRQLTLFIVAAAAAILIVAAAVATAAATAAAATAAVAAMGGCWAIGCRLVASWAAAVGQFGLASHRQSSGKHRCGRLSATNCHLASCCRQSSGGHRDGHFTTTSFSLHRRCGLRIRGALKHRTALPVVSLYARGGVGRAPTQPRVWCWLPTRRKLNYA